MNRDQIKAAADALGRLEALEEALRSLDFAPHSALPISFFDKGEDDDHQSDDGIKAYYPREKYRAVIELLEQMERVALTRMGVSL